jgi:hypothetical protein
MRRIAKCVDLDWARLPAPKSLAESGRNPRLVASIVSAQSQTSEPTGISKVKAWYHKPLREAGQGQAIWAEQKTLRRQLRPSAKRLLPASAIIRKKGHAEECSCIPRRAMVVTRQFATSFD